MKSLMTFIGILAFNFSATSQASEFACPLSHTASIYTCAGTVRVQNIAQLNTYKNDLGIVGNSTVAKALLIDFSPNLTEDISIASPCAIKTSLNITINSTGSVCLNAKKGLLIEEGFHFNGKNLKLESIEDVVVNKNSVINAQDIRLLSIGSAAINQAFIRDGADIHAANITIESLNKGFIGKNSIIELTGTLGIYSHGDEEASIREGTKVKANKIDVQSTVTTIIANLVELEATEVNLNGAQGCNVSKGAVITATERIGNCFLHSLTAEKFSIDKNRGTNPLTVTFNASGIAEAQGYVWNFGDGQTLSTLNPTTTHTYSSVGSFSASLMYGTQNQYSVQKSAGSVQIDVKAAPVVVPSTPPRGYFTYAQDGTFVYLRGFIRKTQNEIASAYYVIDDNQNNKIYMTNFYANSQSNVEMNTFGNHKITMYVEDTQGLKYNTSLNVFLQQQPENIAPVVRFYGEQSALKTLFINMRESFVPSPDENLKEFTVDFGDGDIEHVENASSAIHTYAQAGTYNVKVSAEYNGIIRSVTQAIAVTNVARPILTPLAGFYYYVLEYSGNVVLTDDRSQSPNGEIISYEWNFGNGMIAYGQQAAHFFSPGSHLVTLTVTDMAGLRSSQTQKIYIQDIGETFIAKFGYNYIENKDLEIEFFALDELSQISRVKIDWGDGKSELFLEAEISNWGLYSAHHVYQNFGNYNVKLTVDTIRGVTRNENILIYVKPPIMLVAQLQCSVNVSQVSCNTVGSSITDGSLLTYSFDFGDGKSLVNTSGDVIHNYLNAGTYIITLRVTSSSGKIAFDNYSATVLTNPKPIADGYCTSFSPQSINCFSTSSDPFGSPLTTHWSIGTYSEVGEIFNATTSSGGIVYVQLLVTSLRGTSSTITIPVSALENKQPVAISNCSKPESNLILCKSESYDSDGSIVSTRWNLSDGRVFNGTSFTIEINELILLDINLEVTDNLGKKANQNNSFNLSLITSTPIDSGSNKCIISNEIKYKSCSSLSYTSNSENDLNNYLSHGVFDEDGNLKNLIIASSIEKASIEVASPCNVTIKEDIALRSLQGNICLRGAKLSVNDRAHLEATGNKEIYLAAKREIIINGSSLLSEGSIRLDVNDSDPFLNGIKIFNTMINSGELFLDSKDSINIDAFSSIVSSSKVYNGKNCMISSGDFLGTCLVNPIPNDLEISRSDDIDPQTLNLQINNLDQGNYKIKWRLNRESETITEDANIKFKIEFPGIVLVEALIYSIDGSFRLLEKKFTISPNSASTGQVLALQFFEISSNSNEFNGYFNNNLVKVVRNNVLDGNLLYVYFNSIDNETNSFTIPNLNYSVNITKKLLPTISNPGDYIEDKFQEVENILNSIDIESPGNSNSITLSLRDVLSQLRLEVQSYTEVEKALFAKSFQSNYRNDLNLIVSNNKTKFKLLDLLIPSASADLIQTITDLKISAGQKLYVAVEIVGISGGIGMVGGGAILLLAPSPQLKAVGVALIILGTATIVAKLQIQYKMIDRFWDWVVEKFTVNISLIDGVYSFQGQGVTKQLDENRDSTHSSSLIRAVARKVKNMNNYINGINKTLSSASNVKLLGFIKAPYFGRINNLKFPVGDFQGYLDPKFLKTVKVVSKINEFIEVANESQGENALNVKFNSFKSQVVTLVLNYSNTDFGINKDFETEVTISVADPLISQRHGNRDVEFTVVVPPEISSEPFQYAWTFGDNKSQTTANKVFIHRYEESKTYNATLRVYDKYTRLVFNKEIEVEVKDYLNISVGGSVDDSSLLLPYMNSTTYKGFNFQYTFPYEGTCYGKEISYISNGQHLQFYNCSRYNLIP